MAKKKKAGSSAEKRESTTSPIPVTDEAPVDTPAPSATSNEAASSSTPPEENKQLVEETKIDKTAEADRLKERGNTAFKAQDYKEATKLYSEAIDLDPSQAAYHANRAAARIALKQFRLALEDCQQARSLQQQSPQLKTLLRLARCQLATGSPEPALSTLREAQALNAEPSRDLWQLKSNAETMLRHLDSVAKARVKGEWSTASAALDAARKMLEGEGKDVPTQWRCWTIEFRIAAGSWDAAMDAVRDALRCEGNSPDVHALRGQLLFLTNKPTEATSILRQALTLDPEHAAARKLLKRVRALEKVKEEGNNDFKRSNWNDAVSKYSEALEIVGSSPEEGRGGIIRAILLSNRAIAFSKIATTEAYESALEDIAMSLTLHPDNWKAVRTRARIRLAQDDFEVAISDFKEALELVEAGEGHGNAMSEIREELRKAEVLLKRSKEKDYYKILGLARSATTADIKKAYRKESMKHHPDKGGDEETFKLVVEAHAVLSDPDKRHRYDMGEDIDGQMNSQGAGGFPGGVDISEMLFAQASALSFRAVPPKRAHRCLAVEGAVMGARPLDHPSQEDPGGTPILTRRALGFEVSSLICIIHGELYNIRRYSRPAYRSPVDANGSAGAKRGRRPVHPPMIVIEPRRGSEGTRKE